MIKCLTVYYLSVLLLIANLMLGLENDVLGGFEANPVEAPAINGTSENIYGDNITASDGLFISKVYYLVLGC